MLFLINKFIIVHRNIKGLMWDYYNAHVFLKVEILQLFY